MFDLLIIVKTSKGLERVIITGVTDYSYDSNKGVFIIEKDNYRNFVPREGVVFIGKYSETISIE